MEESKPPANPQPSASATAAESSARLGRFPAGTTPEDHACWVCDGPTLYRQCRIICIVCGFTRDCSDP